MGSLHHLRNFGVVCNVTLEIYHPGVILCLENTLCLYLRFCSRLDSPRFARVRIYFTLVNTKILLSGWKNLLHKIEFGG